MNKTATQTAKSTLLRQALIVVAATVLCFLVAGGWRIIGDYSNWHYEIFLHANGVEEYLSLLNWLASGPAWGALIGAAGGIALAFAFEKQKTENTD